jgi:hypothetical protein
MTIDEKFRELAESAWWKAGCHPLEAVYFFRRDTGVSLIEAVQIIEATAKRLGKPFKVVWQHRVLARD